MTASPEDIERAAAVLRAGGLVAFPTETVYGLGADAVNPAAVRRVFEVKGRPATHPLIVHLGSAAALDRWAVDVPPAARLLAEACWPGPLTMLLRRSPSVPDVVTGGRDTVGLRVPAHPLALALLERFGGGVAAPSANRFGRVSPTTAADVQADLGSDVDLVLDGGPCQVGVESTIVDLTGAEPEVLRPGGVSFERLEEVLGRPVGLWLGDRDVAAPGTLPAHYAPAARVEVLDDVSAVAERAAQLLVTGRRVAVLAPVALAGLPDGVVELEPAGGPESYARVLYGRLRQADRLGVEVVLAVPPERVGVGVAVRDRLIRAAAAGRAAPGHGSST
ncbi:L-threonylcarbamoyladenylate synthase [Rhabdothermincola sediminis]|uniref:L-threonylcarbamoyladenylate synthase n=1 Tax=Rhabdothermincola sediminis TaxID=2751370 RepID=UPI001AA0180E|nr:L-threonylcarbamoyladenylate synthase [Rhabdothermincola sediminis]